MTPDLKKILAIQQHGDVMNSADTLIEYYRDLRESENITDEQAEFCTAMANALTLLPISEDTDLFLQMVELGWEEIPEDGI